MEAYYRERASEYDKFYEVPERYDDLVHLRTWLAEQVRGRTILEVAAGTGYWTEVAASVAKAITVTDINAEMLAIAAKRPLGPHASLLTADAYALPEFATTFDAGMAHLWWSHVEKQRRQEFLSHFVARLQPRAILVMIDQNYVEGLSGPVSRRDGWGNQYAVRKLENGMIFEIIKNYPNDEELRDSLAGHCEDVRITRLRHFWALGARIRA
jgi:ubiquinone/menaquinone biosynthesis C-methylase UbiE